MNRFFAALVIVFFCLHANLLNAQKLLILEAPLTTQASFNTFSSFKLSGDTTWTMGTSLSYGATFTYGYANCVAYFISPAMDLSAVNNPTLIFQHTRGSGTRMSIGVAEGWYKVFATANYTGDPTTTEWIEIENVIHAPTTATAWVWYSSGELTIPEAAKSENTRIAFRYQSGATASQSAGWRVKQVRVTGDPVLLPNEKLFKIATWNVQWLGNPAQAPLDMGLQMRNVAEVIRAVNPDLIALQEICVSATINPLDSIVLFLGNGWSGNILPWRVASNAQSQGIIYKTDKVQYVSSSFVTHDTNGDGVVNSSDAFYTNWSSGRFPVLYNVNLVVGEELFPLAFLNIHAKALPDLDGYTRRVAGLAELKPVLDAEPHSSSNLVMLGDFNDYLIGTSCTDPTCVGADSPYKIFMDDPENYNGITAGLWQYNSTNDSYWPNPTIDNIVLSSRLFDYFVPMSAFTEINATKVVVDCGNTTSDHTPVSALLKFTLPSSGTTELNYIENIPKALQLYPNPAKNQLQILGEKHTGFFAIFDLLGRQCIAGKLTDNTINVSQLNSGVYFLKINDKIGKFIKE